MTHPIFLRATLLGGMALLAACGTPQEQCIAGVTRDIRVLDRLIAESEANLQRGYALREVVIPDSRYVLCHPGRPAAAGQPAIAPQYCWRDFDRTVTRPAAINLADERVKLAEMKKKQAQLSRAAAPAIAQCRALYPE